MAFAQEILKLKNKLRQKRVRLDKLKNATHSLNVFIQDNHENARSSVSTEKPKYEDINLYMKHLSAVRDGLEVTKTTDGVTDSKLRGNAARLKKLRETQLLEAINALNNQLAALKGILATRGDSLSSCYQILKDKASVLSETKLKFKTLGMESTKQVLKKADEFDAELKILEELMKRKKNLLINLYSLDTELGSCNLYNRFLQFDIEIKYHSESLHKGRIDEICNEKNKLLELITGRLDHIEGAYQRIKNFIMKANRLEQDSTLSTNFFSDNEQIDNLRREFEKELERKLEEREQLKERLIIMANISPEDLDGPLGPDGYLFVIEEMTIEIVDRESIRTELLRKLKNMTIMNIRLSHEVFEASRDARHYEGLWELASVDENIILHNHLYSVLISLREQLEEVYTNVDNTDIAKLQSEIGERTQDVITLQKQKEYLTQEINLCAQLAHRYDVVLKYIEEDEKSDEYRMTIQEETIKLEEAEKRELQAEQELEAQRQAQLQRQIEERMRREQQEAERKEKLKLQRLAKEKAQKLEIERLLAEEIDKESERQKRYEETKRQELEHQKQIEEERLKARELKMKQEIEAQRQRIWDAQRKKQEERQMTMQIEAKREKELQAKRQKEIQEMLKREQEDQQLRAQEEDERKTIVEVSKNYEIVKIHEADSKQAYLDESTPGNELSTFNLHQRMKDYNITVEESKQGGLNEESSITKTLRISHNNNFGIQEFLDESNIEKIKIQEEESKENNRDSELQAIPDDLIDDTRDEVGIGGFARTIVKQGYFIEGILY